MSICRESVIALTLYSSLSPEPVSEARSMALFKKASSELNVERLDGISSAEAVIQKIKMIVTTRYFAGCQSAKRIALIINMTAPPLENDR